MSESDWFTLAVSIGVAGGGAFMSTLHRTILRQAGIGLMVFGLVILAVWFGYFRLAGAQPTPPPISGNCNAIGNDNSNCSPYINQAPEKIRFSESLGEFLVKQIPNDKPLEVQAVGSDDDREVGAQIAAYLKSKGYNVTLTNIGMMAPPPNKPLTLRNFKEKRALVVFPGAQ